MVDRAITNSPTHPRRMWLSLGGWLLVSFAAASLGGLFMPGDWLLVPYLAWASFARGVEFYSVAAGPLNF